MTESDVKQIKKGILKILILKLLQQEKKYGYELLVEMSQKSKGFFKVKEGTLYPILYKLEEDGLVISEWEIPHDKMRVKKYYSITQKGSKGQILRPTPNTAPLICGACYNTQPEDLLTMA